jgi:hypothetical protein
MTLPPAVVDAPSVMRCRLVMASLRLIKSMLT